MQAPVRYCPKCGHANQAQFQFCASCSGPLPPVMAAPPPMVAMMPPPGYAWTPYGWQDLERQKQIDRTKTGALLLVVAFGIAWIPLVGAIGGIVQLIAIIFMALGRKGFGPAHARNVLLGVVLWLIGILLAVVVGVLAALRIIGAFGPFGGVVTPEDLIGFFDMIVIGVLIGAAIGGLMIVLFGVGLSEKNGKILLILGYVSSMVVAALLFLLLRQGIVDLAQNLNSQAALQRITDQTTLLTISSVIPYSMYALAFFLIFNRIKRGEIPAGPAQPPMAMPAYPGMMPIPSVGSPTMPPSQPPSMPPSGPPASPPGPGMRP